MKSIINLILTTAVAIIAFAMSCNAHAPNQSYLYLSIFESSIEGRFEINTNELSIILSKEVPSTITADNIQQYKKQIHNYLSQRSSFSSVFGNHPIVFGDIGVMKAGSLGAFILVQFRLDNISQLPDDLDIYYNLLFDQKFSHSGFCIIENNWKAGIRDNEAVPALVFRGDDTWQSLDTKDGSILTGTYAMIKEGIWHIWIGFDHILFLLALILPSVINRTKRTNLESTSELGLITRYLGLHRLAAVDSFKEAFIYIIKIVTFFTIAHTITLSLAALNIIVLPTRLVESIIAISIALAAIHNFRPFFIGNEWILAFGFGIFHGFGFASVLYEIGMIGEYLGYSLFGFNVGVELGQIAIICVVFPVLFLIRNTTFYQLFFYAGSAILIFISLYWFTERAFDIDLQLANTLAAILRSFS